MTYDKIAVRKALVAKGLRTYAYSFDGSGDSGSLEEMLVADDLTRSLESYDDRLEECFSSKTVGTWVNAHIDETTGTHVPGKYHYTMSPAFAAADAIIECVDGARDVLQDLAYSALEHFDGDWCNNDGGYGIVAVDLLTGEFKIDGWQRYSDTNAADSYGTCVDAIDDDSPLDLTKHLKSTLNVS